jgi:alpha-L-glutamate ligase-like protein
MTWESSRYLHELGILGMNRRNAEFIMRFNPRSAFPRVDDKILTKRLAVDHQIPTPPLYHIIEYHGDISGFERAVAGHPQFVVKPARGSGGGGIVLVTGRSPEGFVKPSGEVVSKEDLVYHISGILSGIYSLEGLEDRALIEALVIPDPIFAAISYQGVPDIRIIVYRGVPLMAMVRLPTRSSDGKANLHQGAIGVGIDMKSGKTMNGVHHSLVIDRHPDTNQPVNGIQVPYWEKMLRIAARSSEMTGLGYVGVDLVVDRELGPLLLELNARPGLAIQIANRDGLYGRLKKIDQAPLEIFASLDARIAWTMETFGVFEILTQK